MRRLHRWPIAFAMVGMIGLGVNALPQTLATRHVMKQKLAHSQRILESLMTSDFDTLERESEALSHVVEQPGWGVLTTPEYIHYSSAFLTATTELVKAARAHDLDGAAGHYTT